MVKKAKIKKERTSQELINFETVPSVTSPFFWLLLHNIYSLFKIRCFTVLHKKVVWHDVISNSVSKHQSVNYAHCHSGRACGEPIQHLLEFWDRIRAIVHVQRNGSPNILQELLGLSFRLSKKFCPTKTNDAFSYQFVEQYSPLACHGYPFTACCSQRQQNLNHVSVPKTQHKNSQDRVTSWLLSDKCRSNWTCWWHVFDLCDK